MKEIVIEIYIGKDSQWYCRVKARNGEPMFWSEGYSSKHNAKYAAEWLKEHCINATIVDLH
jgi:uncharacterized protein YegP (UPF0339 family)